MSKLLHVAIIGSRGYPIVYSGYETFVKELSERMVQQNIKVTVYCHAHLFPQKPKQQNGVNLVYIPTLVSKSFSQLIHSFQCFIHAGFSNADVLLVVNAANGPFGLIAKLFRKKATINVDGIEWRRPKWKGLGAKYFKFAAWASTKFYPVVITDAFAMQEVYEKTFQCKSKVIAYGATIRYSQNPNLIEAFKLKPQEYYLIVGRLIPDNNVLLMIKGFLASTSTKKLVVVGDVPYQDSYARAVKSIQDDRLIFTGYIHNADVLAELYHQCYAYLHGHEFGGTNPTMLKAMAYGCAIMALDTPFNQEMLQGGKYGWFFQKQAQSIAACIDSAEENPSALSELRSTSRSGILPRYQWDEVTKEYVKLFESLSRID